MTRLAPHLRDGVAASPSSPLGLYLREIRDDALLSAADEVELARRAARGDAAARDRMIRANLRLVVKIARGYLDRGLGLEDLVGEGNLGLIRAVQDFDPARGTRFSTYAAHWIKQAIRQAVGETGTTIRLPAHMIQQLTRWRRAEGALSRTTGRPAGFDAVADALGLAPDQRGMVDHALRTRHVAGSSSTPAADEPGRLDEEARDAHPGPADEVADADLRREVARRLSRLDGRERLVIVLHFGLEGERPHTLGEIGARLGVTREWARKIEARALARLRGDAPTPPPARPRRGAAPAAELALTA